MDFSPTVGRRQLPVAPGTATMPETATALPCTFRETYCTFHGRIAMPPGTRGSVARSQAISVPGPPASMRGGA